VTAVDSDRSRTRFDTLTPAGTIVDRNDFARRLLVAANRLFVVRACFSVLVSGPISFVSARKKRKQSSALKSRGLSLKSIRRNR